MNEGGGWAKPCLERMPVATSCRFQQEHDFQADGVSDMIWWDTGLFLLSPPHLTSPPLLPLLLPPSLFSSCCASELHNWCIRLVKAMGCRIQRVREKKNHPKPYKNSICTSLRCMVGTGGICKQTYFKKMKASRGPECFYSLLILDHLVWPYSAPYRDKKYIRE